MAEMATAPRPLAWLGGFDEKTAESVSATVLEHWAGMLKKGKPQAHENTVLCAFVVAGLDAELEGVVAAEGGRPPLKVVALGTGTKCLSAKKRSLKGDVLNDSHAEVIARRALNRWLMAELAAAMDDAARDDLFEKVPDCKAECSCVCPKWKLRAGLFLHMYISQAPCGDSSILLAAPAAGQGGGEGGPSEAVAVATTGAKVVGGAGAPPPGQGDVEKGAPQLAALRRKPGKGDATLSMSCSDKICKWALLGVQGSFLSRFLDEAIPLTSIVVGVADEAERPAVQAALERAVPDRWRAAQAALAAGTPVDPPVPADVFEPPGEPPIMAVCRAPPEATGLVPGTRKSKSGFAINWDCGLLQKRGEGVGRGRGRKRSFSSLLVAPHGTTTVAWAGIHEVTLAASGRKAGTAKTTSAWESDKTRSSLCKADMAAKFCQLLKMSGSTWLTEVKRAHGAALYRHLKGGCAYVELWKRLRAPGAPFAQWLPKGDEHEAFACLEEGYVLTERRRYE